MPSAIGLIYTNSDTDNMQGLAKYRPVAAVPYGGRYRLIDFALSSMVNSGLRTIGLITSHHFRPLSDHLGAGQPWFLDRKGGGLFILPGALNGLVKYHNLFRLRDLQQNYEFLVKDYADHVIICTGNQVFDMRFDEILAYHVANNADATLIYNQPSTEADDNSLGLFIEQDNTVSQISNLSTQDTDKPRNAQFLNTLLIRRDLLMDIIKNCTAWETETLINVLADNIKKLKVFGYNFPDYFKTIDSVQDYYAGNMELLIPDIHDRLLMGDNPIHTKFVNNPPTRYTAQAEVSNSIIASGCTINGKVENSILSRGVVVEKGASIKNSILMQRCIIRTKAQVEYAILDKETIVDPGTMIKGNPDHLMIMKKGRWI